MSKKDITGHRFGRLIALRPTELRSTGSIMWECICACGNFTVVKSSHLTNRRIRSCGCYSRELTAQRNLKDLAGLTYGRLRVLRPSKYKPKTGRSVNWLCKCSCGKYTIVASGNLQRGRIQSCGCYWKEQIITHGTSNTKEYKRIQDNKRREAEHELDSEWTLAMELALIDFFPGCVLCGSTKNLSRDHVLPLSRGYGLKPGNAIRLCVSCNSKKNNKDINNLPLEWQVNLIYHAFDFKDKWEALQHGL